MQEAATEALALCLEELQNRMLLPEPEPGDLVFNAADATSLGYLVTSPISQPVILWTADGQLVELENPRLRRIGPAGSRLDSIPDPLATLQSRRKRAERAGVKIYSSLRRAEGEDIQHLQEALTKVQRELRSLLFEISELEQVFGKGEGRAEAREVVRTVVEPRRKK